MGQTCIRVTSMISPSISHGSLHYLYCMKPNKGVYKYVLLEALHAVDKQEKTTINTNT